MRTGLDITDATLLRDEKYGFNHFGLHHADILEIDPMVIHNNEKLEEINLEKILVPSADICPGVLKIQILRRGRGVSSGFQDNQDQLVLDHVDLLLLGASLSCFGSEGALTIPTEGEGQFVFSRNDAGGYNGVKGQKEEEGQCCGPSECIDCSIQVEKYSRYLEESGLWRSCAWKSDVKIRVNSFWEECGGKLAVTDSFLFCFLEE
ncbi:hypothetical protein BSKO_12186 [Bryopsis sp. KO-2023]|nr:hypothetical protein BSKO_12186 [Bryopsis sp. KO-2023]